MKRYSGGWRLSVSSTEAFSQGKFVESVELIGCDFGSGVTSEGADSRAAPPDLPLPSSQCLVNIDVRPLKYKLLLDSLLPSCVTTNS